MILPMSEKMHGNANKKLNIQIYEESRYNRM